MKPLVGKRRGDFFYYLRRWRADVGRFANRAWVMSQQLHYLLERTRLGVYYYPERCENWKETTKEKNK